jgi:hypothetical protein
MKRPKITFVIALSLMTGLPVVTLSSLPSSASSGTKYFCGQSQGKPATIAQTPTGQVVVIRWTSTIFPPPYTPEERCQIVSDKFQQYHQNGTLRYLTTGRENRQLVVCTAQSLNGGCVGTLFTLKPGSNPKATLKALMNVGSKAVKGAVLQESYDRAYFDMKEFLNSAPREVSATAQPRSATTPSDTVITFPLSSQ